MGVNLQFVKGTGPGNRIVAKDIENAKSAGVSAAPAAPAAPAPTTYKSTRVFATPDAKKVAKTENIKLETVVGSGNFGRITAEDVLRAAGKATVSWQSCYMWRSAIGGRNQHVSIFVF